jgi:hypothetical protein
LNVVQAILPAPVGNAKVRMLLCEPKLALAADRSTYDVIVSAPDHVSLLRSANCFTREYYALAAARLAKEGIFCQRVSAVDLGPTPLQWVAATFQAVFANCLAIELTPGEYLFLGTNGEQGLVRPKLLARAQAPHVRRILARMGLDWSVLLNVPAYNQEALSQFVQESGGAAQSTAKCRWALAVPRDVMRWGFKLQETQQQLAPMMGRLLNWMGDEADSDAVLRRLAEVKAQQDLMGRYADQYWAYRATLRAQMTNRPRGKIVQASAQEAFSRMHPEDKRRMAYLKALGKAVKTRSPEDIERLAAFEAPYDPLISYFLHHEAAELYRRGGRREPAKELAHRLHAIFYSSPRDASLHNVVEAIKLLRDHPEAVPEPRPRWQTLNALLQALRQRWEARAGIRPPTARAAIADIDDTLSAAEMALAAMQDLAGPAAVSPNDWRHRAMAIERMLIRPVKNYRSQLQPHLLRNQPLQLDDSSIEEEPSANDAGQQGGHEQPAGNEEPQAAGVVPADARVEE